ncbi:MAG: DUF3990 domain-containing protein [Lachnospiraceae bacterium]|nr:DUF3990 domain-containing protein [Lachnospiraceae bacterium]
MLLYHGSNTDVKAINLAMCRPYKDFGRGFYLTDLKEQAEKMATRVARLYEGKPVMNVFEIDDDFLTTEGLNVKDFGKEPSEEWARFVMNNRNRRYMDYSSPECNFDDKYDIVIGPIANDDMAVLFRQYENGVLSFENMVSGMIYKETTNQYSFHTERAIALLRKVSF